MSKYTERRQALAREYPEMDQKFQELMAHAGKPRVQRLGQTLKEQRERGQSGKDLSLY